MASVLCHLCGKAVAGAREGDRCPSDDRALVAASQHAAHPQDPYLGRFVGGYPLLGLVRPSSVGPTYRALKEPGRREVAVKVLRPAGPVDPFAARLRKVMPAVFGLTSPSLFKPLDWGVDGELLFVVTEPLKGTPLSELVADRKPLPAEHAAPIVVKLLRALADAHAHDLVHGNLKPSNILVSPGADGEDEVRLLELGIAEVLRPRDHEAAAGSETVGTPFYLSPEQAKGLPASPSGDLYSTGVILYELLSGAPPYDLADPMQTARAHVEAPVPRFPEALKIPEALDRVVCRALAKTAADRFKTVGEMADALEEILSPGVGDEDEPARPTQPLTAADLPTGKIATLPDGGGDGEEAPERSTQPLTADDLPGRPGASPDEQVTDPMPKGPTPAPPATEEPVDPRPGGAPREAASAPAPKDPTPATPRPAPVVAEPPARPPRRSKLPFVLGGIGVVLLLLAVAFFAIRATPPDGSGSMLDLVRTVGGGGDEARLAIPDQYEEEPARPGEPPRPKRPARPQAPKPVDAVAVPEPPDAAAEAPPAAPPDAATPEPPAPEAMLGPVEKPDGSLLVNCSTRCKVYVDGGLVGESPKAGIPLKEGEHQLRVVNLDNGDANEQVVQIKSAQRTRVTVQF